MDIFIDANIYLSFYEQSADALVELTKLAAVIKNKAATLWLPDQVKREFWKNRDGSIASALREFDKLSVLGAIPRLVQEDAEFKDLGKLAKEIEKKKAGITSRVRDQVAKEATKADLAVRSLFGLAKEIDTAGSIFAEAQERALRRTPPGKQDGLGDRLAWVALLRSLPPKADLDIISDDGDYAGEFIPKEINPYLRAEWARKNGGSVRLWKRASQFLAAHYPDAATAIEIERTLMIESLESSRNFMTTHAVVGEFSDISHMSVPLAERLANAILNNSQVRWLLGDDDVGSFAKSFLAEYGAKISAPLKEAIEKALESRA